MKVLKRAAEYIFIFFVIISLNFLIPRLMPGDPFTYLSSCNESEYVTYSEEQIERYKAYYGLDKPLKVQYRDYLKKTLKGDLGYSIYYNTKVISIIKNRVLWTMGITLVSLLISSFLGVILGSISAFKKDSIFDRFMYFINVVLSEIPSFLIAILLLFTLGAKSKLFPLSGGETVFSELTGLARFKDIIQHGFLPTLALILAQTGGFYLLARNSMITILSKEYMTTAEAKGLRKKRIVFKHGLKNAILPVVTKVFLSLGTILSGALLVENVFNYPGIGKLMKDAVFVRDYVLIQGIFLFVTVFVLVANLLSDIVYKRIDPRVRYDEN